MREGMMKSNIPIPQELQEIMEQVDSDGSGEIDYTEFLAATLDRRAYEKGDVCWAAFRVFDLDRNGKITRDELAQVLYKENGDPDASVEEVLDMNRAEIEKLIKEADQD